MTDFNAGDIVVCSWATPMIDDLPVICGIFLITAACNYSNRVIKDCLPLYYLEAGFWLEEPYFEREEVQCIY